jgi:hypothetical protein
MTVRPVHTTGSRRELMLAAGAAVVLAGCGDSDPQPPRERRDTSAAATDLAILDLLLTLEYFTADVYERMVSDQVLTRIDRDNARSRPRR